MSRPTACCSVWLRAGVEVVGFNVRCFYRTGESEGSYRPTAPIEIESIHRSVFHFRIQGHLTWEVREFVLLLSWC